MVVKLSVYLNRHVFVMTWNLTSAAVKSNKIHKGLLWKNRTHKIKTIGVSVSLKHTLPIPTPTFSQVQAQVELDFQIYQNGLSDPIENRNINCTTMRYDETFSTTRHLTLTAVIRKTCVYNFDPLKPHSYIVKLGFTGVYIIFLISAQKHKLWVLVRTASPRRF